MLAAQDSICIAHLQGFEDQAGTFRCRDYHEFSAPHWGCWPHAPKRRGTSDPAVSCSSASAQCKRGEPSRIEMAQLTVPDELELVLGHHDPVTKGPEQRGPGEQAGQL
jgi:hypothetical protein